MRANINDIKLLHILNKKKGLEKIHFGGNMEEKLDVSFYNCSNNEIYPITLTELQNMGLELSSKFPLSKMLWYPNCTITNHKFWFYIQVLLFHLLPAIFMDNLLRLFKQKPLLVKIQRRIFMANMALAPFLTKNWTFLNYKCLMLERKLKADELKNFGYDKDNMNIYEYFENCTRYAIRYIFKDEIIDEEMAKRNGYRMYLLDKFVKSLFYIFLFWLLVYKVKVFGLITHS